MELVDGAESFQSFASVDSRVAGSFRDPSGYVFQKDGEFYRTISPIYAKNWRLLLASGFAKKAIDQGLLLPFEEIPAERSILTIKPQKIPFISYPYEWSFGQLKRAALLTLKLQILALEHGLVLKDASAYNIQFIGHKAIFIDHLSFEEYVDGRPWAAYQQFCKHFYAPLLLAKGRGFFVIKMLSQWLDGIPLDVASRLLPVSTKLSPSILLHIHAHAKMQSKYSDGRDAAQKAKSLSVSKDTVIKLSQALYNAVQSISLPKEKTEWGNYYQDTNYTEAGTEDKHRLVDEAAAKSKGNFAIDLGANTGVFSEILAKHHKYVISTDIDPLAIEKNFRRLSKKADASILPLVIDLGNPSPGLGWAGEERDSFQSRCSADCVTALALIHHLVMTAGIPLPLIAEYFAELIDKDGMLIIEFIPKEDSQIQRLLAAREDIFFEYTKDNFMYSFGKYFDHIEENKIKDSIRTLHIFRKK